MDEGLSDAVRKVFVELYKKGYIYRGQRMINWCPAAKSALSDEEVIYRDVPGKFYYFRYPLCEGDGYLLIATTRPETMFGDTAVAVHPTTRVITSSSARWSNCRSPTGAFPSSATSTPIRPRARAA